MNLRVVWYITDASGNILTYLDYLKKNTSPFDTVKDYWQKTFSARRDLLKKLSIAEYVKLFPILVLTKEAKELVSFGSCK